MNKGQKKTPEKVFSHLPVLLKETIESLLTNPNGFYVDGTFGRGGHSRAMLSGLSASGRLYAMDCDEEAVKVGEALESEDSRFQIKRGNFSKMTNWMDTMNLKGELSGILLDLGVSSPQLEKGERGFSFNGHHKLDMRMDQSLTLDAATWLNKVEEKELQKVLFENGEARYSRIIAKTIVNKRQTKPLEYTDELAELIARIIPTKLKHPATRTFQAIRIFINQEIKNLKDFLSSSIDLLQVGGRLLVITFHSLEEQIIKEFIKKNTTFPSWIPLPAASIDIWIKKIGRFKPSAAEILENPRARSATLTVMERIK